jgi:hypothetical protein
MDCLHFVIGPNSLSNIRPRSQRPATRSYVFFRCSYYQNKTLIRHVFGDGGTSDQSSQVQRSEDLQGW